jgi:hypothetical protein
LPVTVDYSTQEASATAGEDYLASSGTLTYLPGDTRATVRVPLIDDARPEPDEMLGVVLRNAVNATVVGPNPVTLHIANDDPFSTWLPVVLGGP